MPAGSGTLRLLFTIDADDKGAQAALKSLEQQLGQTGKAVGGLTPDVQTLSTKLLGLSGAGGETTSAITGLTEAIGGMAGTVTLGAVAALAALAAGLAACVAEAISLGSQLHDLSQTTGLSVENLSALRLAAVTSGSSLEELSQSFVRFERAATEGGDKATAALAHFGLTAEDVTRDPEAAFDQFLKKFNEIGPSAQRTTDTMALFGRGGARLIPTFLELGEGLEGARKKAEELGIAFTNDMANKADEVGDKLDALKLQLQAVFVKVGEDLLPVMGDLATALTVVVKAGGELVETLGLIVGSVVRAVDVMPELQAGWLVMRAIWNAIRDDVKAHGGFADIVTPPKPPEIDPWRAFGHDFMTVAEGLITMKEPIKSLGAVVDKVPDLAVPGVDEDAQRKAAEKGGLIAIDVRDKLLKAEREKRLRDEIAAGLGLLNVKKEHAKKEKDPTFDEDKANARARLDQQKRLSEQEQAQLKADLRDKVINQDQFAAFMSASDKQIAEAHKKQINDQLEIDLRSAKTPDQRAGLRAKAANDIANIESALNVQLIDIEGERVRINADASDKIQKEDEKLKKSKEKLAEDIHDFWFKQGLAINEAIAKTKPEDVKLPGQTTVTQDVIADIKAQVAALDPLTRAWRETQQSMQDYFDAVQKGTASIADANAQLDKMIQKLVDQSFQLLLAGQAWKGIGLFITKALPLAFLSAFNQQLHKMIDAYIQTGHTGPAAMKQLVAGTLEALGQMASSWAAFAFSMALVALAMGQYHAAALYFAGGLGLEILALALGFAASKVRPDAGGGGGAGSTTAATLQPPNTTINLGGTAQLGGTPGDLFGAVIASNNRQSEAIERLNGTIAMSSPGDVVTRAAATAPQAFATGVTNASKSSATFNRNLGLNLLPST
jgi:hypothetical protein